MDEQYNLVEVNLIDERLLEIEELKGDLPKILNDQQEESGTLNDSNNSGMEKIDIISSDERKFEAEIDTSKEKLNKYNEQLYLLTSNKEYDALLLEIDHIKNVISKSEDSLLLLNEDKETLKVKIEQNKKRITTLNDQIKQTEMELNESMKDTLEEEEKLNKDKLKAISVVNNIQYQQYQKLKTKYGIGMAKVNRDSCANCFTHLPPQTIVEIQHNKKLINCPNCSVFLFYRDN